ncbi:MAG TPA: energy transducer TonB [Candidatus Sulfotelmatobacter sp.]|nr:energy transducer TonB [Candidatus Sulfotelmatobacter sp.]
MPRFATFVALAIVSLAGVAIGQHGAPPTSPRKVVTHVAPQYPELAHRLHLQGVVKVEAQVRANGSVKTARVLGGNPVLADAVIVAVEKWKFEAAQNESTELVQVSFESQ